MAEEKYVVMPGAEYKGRMPWDRAEALKAELQAGMPDTAGSSAWVMLRAAELWDVGVEDMKQVKTLQTPMGVMYKGILGVVTKISDAVLTDSRIFRLDSPDWLELYNRQVNLEGSKSRAWPALSAQVVEEEALKRQQQEGWDAVRPAIELTVRAWILQGFVANRPNVDPKIALGHYDMALEVLDWGRTASWKDVPVPMKGVVFEDYFVRSVRQLRLESLRAVCGADPSQGPEAPLQRLYDEAKSLVNEMPEVGSPTLPPGEHDPGFVLAFGVYPKGSALTMVGYYHHHMARRCDKHKDHDAAADHIFKAHHAYYQAAKLFPKDDENHAWFLNVSVQMLQICGSPFDVALRVTEAVRLALPEMKKIWAHSAAAMQDRNAAFTLSLRLEEKIKKDLADGKIKLDDFMMPDYSMSS
ncbi:hypothetical protein DAEQUDRAFT_383184 [Daedalea quercina L-15889]|uniref:Uncharacterized protein n=1 Tax=Daedalea quercina L-15889 TaxID=1314783 RepID=A0A165P0D0_9APHY|nr:hypothetical protein DAEQUDRAFT_383184 [Daedalea quercina L-15889]